ncbi:class 1 fructose-bisphosphatase [Gilvimarinus polysaccharolyticus]|uniref:class 1 fructose-bisphosphatase n=1 Tax=Gilvimarinus polysaccharolyticus TaxID=863921 RepID=UPI0006730DC3|nr:class 1 fructose-bisphosphatase [Gilvimarinus polysaccharolyticus]
MNSLHFKSFENFLLSSAIELELSTVVKDIVSACTDISKVLSCCTIEGLTGAIEQQNSSGETQKQLDVLSNQILKDKLCLNKSVKYIASEEENNVVSASPSGKFAVAFDPLDGSTNIDVNGSVGTIFSILPALKDGSPEASFFQAGNQQLCAGYILYGPATQLVITFGKGTYIFTLQPDANMFMLTENKTSIPKETSEFSVNMANTRYWKREFGNYIQHLLDGSSGPRQKPYNMRWVGAMVADIHRVICRGGVFLYPSDKREKLQTGKLRLVYEASPMALIIENCGGSAFNESTSLLSVVPTSLHQKVPVIAGSTNEVHTCLNYL